MTDVIIALDTPDAEAALALVHRLGPRADYYKVGLVLFSRAGPDIVRDLVRRDKRVFLDLKLHDIPNTVAGAARAARGLGASLLTVHAAGGRSMVEAAVEAAGEETRVAAVTVLTSLGPRALGQVLGRADADPVREVVRLARLASRAGAWGVVCSGHEARPVREATGASFGIVTPGIRLAGDDAHDQARVVTPDAAIRAGADALVVGRAVTAAPDPERALASVHEAVRAAFVEQAS